MNYLLEITSQPEYIVKFGTKNPQVDNDFDLGKFVTPELVQAPLIYEDAKNGNISFETLVKYDALTAVTGGVLINRKVKDLINAHFPHELQTFPCIINYRKQSTDIFFVMNVYNKIACYDLDKSVYEVNPVDNSYEFEKIILMDAPLEEYDLVYNIIRSAHDNKLVVSEKFRQVMEDNEINSFGFVKDFIMEW